MTLRSHEDASGDFAPVFSQRWFLLTSSLAVAYFAAGRLGLLLPFVGDNVTLIWAPTGISIAFLLRYGRRHWPGVALGAAAVALAVGSSFTTAALIGTGNALEGILGATFLRSRAARSHLFESPRDLIAFFGLGVVVSPIPSAVLGAVALCLASADWSGFGRILFPWWLGNAAGALIVIPCALSWKSPFSHQLSQKRTAEAAAIAIGLVAVGSVVWSLELTPKGHLYPLELLPLPFVIWAALRFRMMGGSFSALAVAVLAMVGSIRGRGPFFESSTRDSLVPLFIFCCMVSIVGLLTAIQAERLLSARATAEFANRAKSEFLANMSHEIRTPMNGVIGLARLLAKADLPPREQQFARQVTRSAEGLLRLLDDLIDLTKVEARKLTIESHDFDFSAMVHEVAAVMGHRAEARGVTLRTIVDPELPARIRSDSTRLRQVLLNLVSNALKFTSKGSVDVKITVVLAPDPSAKHAGEKQSESDMKRLRCEVMDTGIGITSEAQEQLFQPFQQAESSTTRRFGGAGLGLAISKQIVELMGGVIGVHSVPEQGSTFFFEIPLVPAEEAIEEVEDDPFAESLRARRHYYRILTVDDEPVNRMVTHNELLGLGYLSLTVESGSEALNLFAHEHFDLVLMDCQMPEMDGFETTRKMRALEGSAHHVPIIALTASVLHDDRQKCFDAGMDGFVAKPFTVRNLATALDRNLLDSKEPPPAVDTEVIEQLHDLATQPGNSFRDLKTTFLTSSRQRLTAIRKAIASNDPTSVRENAHALRGAATMVGAMCLSQISAQLVTEAVEDLSACSPLLEVAEQERLRVAKAFEAWEDEGPQAGIT